MAFGATDDASTGGQGAALRNGNNAARSGGSTTSGNVSEHLGRGAGGGATRELSRSLLPEISTTGPATAGCGLEGDLGGVLGAQLVGGLGGWRAGCAGGGVLGAGGGGGGGEGEGASEAGDDAPPASPSSSSRTWTGGGMLLYLLSGILAVHGSDAQRWTRFKIPSSNAHPETPVAR